MHEEETCFTIDIWKIAQGNTLQYFSKLISTKSDTFNPSSSLSWFTNIEEEEEEVEEVEVVVEEEEVEEKEAETEEES